jgi:hypothetical protein
LRTPVREALAVLGALALAAVGLGVLDALTWGRVPGAQFHGLFHSVITQVRFNLVENGGVAYGTASWNFFLLHLWTVSKPFGIVALPLIALGAWRDRRATFAVVLFFVVHSAIDHKELRHALPAMPILCALAGVGIAVLRERWRPGSFYVALGFLAAGLWDARDQTFGDWGGYGDYESPDLAVRDYHGPENRLLRRAYRQADLCGIRVETARTVFVGGYAMLHRRVPIAQRGQLDIPVNYVIARAEDPPGGEVVARDGDRVLVRLTSGTCGEPGKTTKHLP